MIKSIENEINKIMDIEDKKGGMKELKPNGDGMTQYNSVEFNYEKQKKLLKAIKNNDNNMINRIIKTIQTEMDMPKYSQS